MKISCAEAKIKQYVGMFKTNKEVYSESLYYPTIIGIMNRKEIYINFEFALFVRNLYVSCIKKRITGIFFSRVRKIRM